MRQPFAMPRERKIAQLGLDQNIDTSLAAGELILHITGAESGAVCLPIRLSWRSEEFGQRHVIAQIPNDVLIDSITPTPRAARLRHNQPLTRCRNDFAPRVVLGSKRGAPEQQRHGCRCSQREG